MIQTMKEWHHNVHRQFELLLHEDELTEIQAAYKMPEEFARDINTSDDKARFYAAMFIMLLEKGANPTAVLRDLLTNTRQFDILSAQGHSLQNLMYSCQNAFLEATPATQTEIRQFVQQVIIR